MQDKSTIEAIVKNTPLAVVIVGLLLFVIGAAGGWPTPSLQVNELGWRIALAAMGALVAGLGLLLLLRDRTIQNFKDVMPREKYNIQIVSPDKGKSAEVDPSFEISGTYKGELKSSNLQVYSVHGIEYWPIMKPGECSVANGVWRAYVHIGGNPGPRTVMVAVGGEAAQALYRYYWKVGVSKDAWTSIDALPPDVTECDRVNVYLK